MCSPIMVFADASYPTLTQFKSRVSDSGSLKQYANTTQPVNYWYWVSTPGVSVMYNDKEDEYQYFDSKWRGLFLWKVGNGDYCTNDTLIKTNYTPQMLNDFQSPPTLYGLQADYVPAFMGGGKDPYYNGEGEKDNIYTLGTTAGSTLVTMYNDTEFKGAVGGHIDNVQSYISNNETWRLCDMFVGKSDAGDWNNYQPKQTPMIPTTVINGEVYYTGNIRFTKQQMDICKKYPNQCQTFTDVIVFYQYNPNAKLTEGGLPGGNNGNGDGDNEGGDEEPTETTTDAVLANPSRLDVGVEVKAKGAEANYKYMNGNVSGSITGAGGMQPGTNSHLVRRNKIELDIFVFNGESIKENLVLDAGSSEGGTPQKLKESEATLEMDTTFDGENNWMWRNRDNTYGFQLQGTAKVTWAVLNKYNGKEYAAVEDILTGAKTDSKGGTTSMTVTAKGFDDGKVL